MADPLTQPDIQTVAGATQFDGSSGTLGLVRFSGYIAAGFSEGVRARVISVTYNGTSTPTTRLDVFLATSAAPGTVAIPLIGADDVTTRVLMCGTIVPKAVNGQSWDLFCITSGKAAAATLIVDWDTVNLNQLGGGC